MSARIVALIFLCIMMSCSTEDETLAGVYLISQFGIDNCADSQFNGEERDLQLSCDTNDDDCSFASWSFSEDNWILSGNRTPTSSGKFIQSGNAITLCDAQMNDCINGQIRISGSCIEITIFDEESECDVTTNACRS